MGRWLGLSLPLVGAMAVSCGGDELTCGSGTKQSGSQCVPVLSDMGGAGGGTSQSELTFDGVTGVAPVSETGLLVTWGSAVPENATFNVYVSKTEDGFNFSSPQATAPAGSHAIEIGALDKSTEYFVTVRASVGGDEDDNTAVKSAKTQKDDEAPKFAGATKAAPAGAAAVKLTWSAAKDDLTPAAAMQYLVYFVKKGEMFNYDSPFVVSAPGATSMVVSGLPVPDTEYSFVVRARDAAGNLETNKITVSAKSGPDTKAPVFAGCTSVESKSAAELEAFWGPATDDTAKQSDLVYELFASKTPDGHNFAEPSFVTEPGAVSGVIPGLDRATTYYVVCRAKDSAGNTDENTVFRSSETKSDGTDPVFDGTPVLQEVGATSFKVSWSAATDNQTASDKIEYRVYLAAASGDQDFKDITAPKAAAGATEITVDGLETNTTYFVVVRAFDLAGNHADSPEFTATTLVSFSKDVQAVFNKNCIGCHGQAQQNGNMRLDALKSYSNTVNVVGSDTTKTRIVPGDPANSWIYQRITYLDDEDPNNDLARMPAPPSAPLTAEEKATILAWISQGALNN